MNFKNFFNKNNIVALLLVSVIALFAFNTAQTGGTITHINFDPDTLSTSTSLDTIDFSIGNYNSAQNYEIQLNADSLSGATGATCTLQLSMDQQGSDWVILETMTVNGVTTRSRETGSFIRGQLRCRCIAPSSTQSTAVRVDWVADRQ